MRLRQIGLCVVVAGMMVTCTKKDDIEYPPSGDRSGGDGPTGTLTASEMLANRDIGGAADKYAADAAANPSDNGAQFGAAFTRFALLPELPAIEALLTRCGQPGVDIRGQLFGPDGFFSHAIADRQGTSTFTVTRTPPGGGTGVSVDFTPTHHYARVWDPGTIDQYVSIDLEDADHEGEEGRIDLDIDVSSSNFTWAVDETYDLATYPWVLSFYVHMDDPNYYYWVETTGGTITVNQAGTMPGDTIELTFTDVTLERWRDDGFSSVVDANYTLSGTLTDEIFDEFEPAADTVPFMDVDDDPGPPYVPGHIQVLESCNPALSVPVLLGVLDEVAAELDGIRGHLDTIASSGNANSFRWELPAGAIANREPIPIGITEVHLLRGLLHGGHGINALLQEYHWLDATFPTLITTYTEYTWDGSRTRRDFDLELLAPQLNADFLRVTGAIDVTGFRSSLQSMLEAGKAALQATPTGATLLNFQAPAAQAASNELVGFADDLIASLTTPQSDDTGNFTFHPSTYFNNPFDRTSMRSAVGGDLWLLTPRDAGTQTNADIQPDDLFAEELMNTFITIATAPDTDIICVSDGACQAAQPVGSLWNCNDWTNQGVCSDAMATSCDPWAFPDTCEPTGTCIDTICGLADPVLFDDELVGNAFDADPPAFINEDVLRSLEDAF